MYPSPVRIRVKNLNAAKVLLDRGWVVVEGDVNKDGLALERKVHAAVILDTVADFLFRPIQYNRPGQGSDEDSVPEEEAAE